MNFSSQQKEWQQERQFQELGPVYHLCTRPVEDGILFQDDAERTAAINAIGIAATVLPVKVFAYALMSNHFHLVLQGKEEDCLCLFERIKRHLDRRFVRTGRSPVMKQARAGVYRIESLKQFRDEIAYVLRNPFVVRGDVNLFTWPWTTAFLYFNGWVDLLPSVPFKELTYKQKREITRSRVLELGDRLRVRGNGLAPESFVDYRTVEALFPDAQRFCFWCMKNVEAHVETARHLGEPVRLTDDDLLTVSLRLCRENYQVKGPGSLTLRQKHELAQKLKYDFGASNGQLARFANLPPGTVDEMFPLSAKR